MKKLILSLAVIALGFGASAQSESSTGFRFGIGLEGSMPFGTFGDVAGFGIGGSAQGEYWVDENLGLTLNAGYIHHSGKDFEQVIPFFGTIKIEGVSQSIIPVLAGIQYKFGESGFFGSAQLGVGIFSVKGGGGSSSGFAYAPGVGYKFNENFDVLVKYQGYSQDGSTANAAGIRVAYTF